MSNEQAQHLYAVHFVDANGEASETQRVYATSEREAMIQAASMLAIQPPASAVVRVLA